MSNGSSASGSVEVTGSMATPGAGIVQQVAQERSERDLVGVDAGGDGAAGDGHHRYALAQRRTVQLQALDVDVDTVDASEVEAVGEHPESPELAHHVLHEGLVDPPLTGREGVEDAEGVLVLHRGHHGPHRRLGIRGAVVAGHGRHGEDPGDECERGTDGHTDDRKAPTPAPGGGVEGQRGAVPRSFGWDLPTRLFIRHVVLP